jgi:hypothetical protein
MTHDPIDGRENDNDLIERVKEAPFNVKARVVQEALDTATDNDLGTALISHVISQAPVAVKSAAVGTAVETAGHTNQERVVRKALQEAHPDTQQQAAKDFVPSQETFDKVWKWAVFAFAIVLGLATLGIFVVIAFDTIVQPETSSVEPAHLQIMLTVFTTTAGVLAGFITGHAVGKATNGGRGNG